MTVFRVFPRDPEAKETEPGGPLFRPVSRAGRIDNPKRYRALYAAGEPECAIAELLGDLPVWDDRTFVHVSGHRLAMATLEIPDDQRVFEMDDPSNLVMLGLRPSRVVSRNRTVTQTWSERVFEMGRSRGVAWWSYYNPDWVVFGLWNLKGASVSHVETLSLDTPAVLSSARAIVRRLRIKRASVRKRSSRS